MKGDLGITKNQVDIILSVITAKVYNAMLLKRIWPEVEKTLKKIRTVFGEINSKILRFWLFVKSLKEHEQKI